MMDVMISFGSYTNYQQFCWEWGQIEQLADLESYTVDDHKGVVLLNSLDLDLYSIAIYDLANSFGGDVSYVPIN